MKILFYGGNGWIASQFIPLLQGKGHEVILSSIRVDDINKLQEELNSVNPDRVICFIGRTHGPGFNSIDYLEQKGKLVENIRDNLFSPVSLAMLCDKLSIHLTYLGTGCIFNVDDPSSCMFSENDDPNFFGSSYSIVKGYTDRLMHLFENILNVRIRMPITADNHPRNFITKIVSYKKICSVANSMTVLPCLLPYLVDMIEKKEIGTINLCNPGIISHNEILEMYKEIIDFSITWENISIDEQDSILSSKRSNNQLDCSRLLSLYPDIPDIHIAIRECMLNM